ncbi:UNKNOWN [Stylonychia lemnae]|uniref:Uncharacterized protein n=1 Tax=Stylonychia lemnae TaxID=5949 RepID=A0A077ZUD5_STYLE|nr:UNKNOWN [Stylonychia lemnae]|eukprot:CDW73184.1 UNKNOWN [Stylonychia lemnae]
MKTGQLLKFTALLLLTGQVKYTLSKVLFSKDLSVNGTLQANEGVFKKLHVKEVCNIDELLSADSIKSKVVDTQQLYVDVIQGLGESRNPIIIQGSLIIEDADEVIKSPAIQNAMLKSTGRSRVQISMPHKLTQSTAASQQLHNPQEGFQRQYADSQNDWVLVGKDDFNNKEDVEKGGWSFTQTSFCQNSQDRFLGGHCLLSNQEVSKEYRDLPKHSKLLVMASLHFLDNWKGETATVAIDNQVSWMKSVRASENSVDLCGGNFKEAAFNVPVIIDTVHSLDTMKLTFKANLGNDPCEKSLGIDNVEVYVK